MVERVRALADGVIRTTVEAANAMRPPSVRPDG